ncbi:MAG TPA: cytochrome C biogenesis protein [Firmicutes bacterium]|jgi:cytochrome c-type biogenesis protein|nr:cytochrome C biogenesis protein [Bacillota bacterium]
MILSLLEWLSKSIEASPALALTAAFVWGILSIILSPCHLASIPLVIGFINEQGRITLGKAFRLSLVFALGILTTIAAIGAITAGMGRIMGDIGKWGNYFVAIIFFIIGLYLLGIINLSWGNSTAQSKILNKGYLSALIMGLLFGIVLGPCTFAYMAPMLGVAFRVAATNLPYAIMLMLMFGLGHCLVIILAGTLTERVQQYLNWTEKSKAVSILRKTCGILVILAGVYFIYNTF